MFKNKFVFLIFILIVNVSYVSGATCTETQSNSGLDDGGLITAINSFPCAGGTITGMTFDASIGASCLSSWYSYDVYVNGSATPILLNQCDQTGIDLSVYLPIASITSVEIKAHDDDAISDAINLVLTLNITYTAVPMVCSSVTTTQSNTNMVAVCATDQEIIGVEVATTGSTSPLNLTELQFNMNGTTNLADVTNINVYYTGTSAIYSAVGLFGSIAPAGGTLTVNGSQTLASGTNYFWIAYDINPVATISNSLDAECSQITVTDLVMDYTPIIINPGVGRGTAICNPFPGGTSQTTDVWMRAGVGTVPTTGTGTLTSWSNGGTGGVVTVNGLPDFNEIGYNFNPKTHFNGDNNYLSHTGVSFGSIYAVVKMEDLTREYTHLSTHQGTCLGPHTDGSLHGGGPTTSQLELTGYASEFDGAGVWRFDGNDATTTTDYTGNHEIISAVANSGDFDAFGDRLLGGQPCDVERDWLGDVSEVIVLTGTSTANERDQIESYLAVKYGLTLGVNGTSKNYYNSDHAEIWNQSSNLGYNFDITGISRDDITQFDQRKSHTEMWTAGVRNDIVTIANGSTFSTPTSFSADKSSLMWGHNNGATINTGVVVNYGTDNGETIQTILQRNWKSEEIGTVGTVVLEFDLNSIVGVNGVIGANDLANLRLLVDEDGDYSDGFSTSIMPSSFNNTTNIAYFQHDFVPLSGPESNQNNGFFFTLGSTNFSTTILPITLNNFVVSCKSTHNVIEWQTLSETNNDHFVIEKSIDGLIFSQIGSVPGAVNSSELINYQWGDTKSGHYSDNAYYRLKQVDFDGAISYSEIISSDCVNESNFKIYPNPFNQEINIKFEALDLPIEVCIKDDLGRLIFKDVIELGKTSFTIQLENSIETGVYYIILQNANFQSFEKIIKM